MTEALNAPPPETHPWVAEVLKRELDHWDGPYPKETKEFPKDLLILRLDILRRISRQVHSLRSQCLASGKKEDLPTLKHWEESIEKMGKLARLDSDFYSLYHELKTLPQRSRVVPEFIFKHLAREKLIRYDRNWEYLLAAEGCKLGWLFWSLTAHVPIAEIEEWDETLRSQLWPKGLILFSEPASLMSEKPTQQEDLRHCAPADHTSWHGNWILLTTAALGKVDLILELLSPIQEKVTLRPLL